MDGWWECKKIDLFCYRLLRAGLKNKIRPTLSLLRNYLKARLFNHQSKSRSHIVAEEHYDVGMIFMKKCLQ